LQQTLASRQVRFYRTNSTGKLSFLNNLAAAFEFEVDEARNTTAKEWEWK
jgi:hypothetical protein